MKSLSRIFLTFAFLLVAIASGRAQVAMEPGVTAWVYRTGELMTQLPTLVGTPAPNYYKNHAQVDFNAPWVSDYPDDDLSYCYGHIWGNLIITTSGTYQFRVTSADGSKFYFNNALVVDNDRPGLNSSTGSVILNTAAHYPFYLNFYQNPGSQRVLLEWMPPGGSQFVTVPASAFETEQGQTFVTSPGVKSWTYPNGSGGTAGGPGDGTPLTAVHPSFTLENFRPAGFNPRVGGLAFLPDGRLVVTTWDSTGGVYLVDGLQGAGPVTYKLFARGLGEPLGVCVQDGDIYVAQKREITRLRDLDGDGFCDEYETVASGWPASYNYHEFTFNLVYKDGFFWCTTSTPLKSGDTTYLDGKINGATAPGYPVINGPGSYLKIDPVAHTWEIASSGLRTPNGMGLGVDGEIFCGDNQGDWMPSSKINHMIPGKYYGVPSSSTQSGQAIYPPVAWMPHDIASNSPTQPVLVTNGTYAGQMLFGELTDGGLLRMFVEKINNTYQGVVFRFSEGFEVGLNRIAWGPDGCLYAGGVGSGGNWNWQGTTQGLQRIRPNGNTTFEMLSVKSRADGFQIEFTQPVQPGLLPNPANYAVQQYQQVPSIGYGAGNQSGKTTLTVTAAKMSPDRKKVFLQVAGLQTNRVAYLRVANLRNDADAHPWTTEAWYTLNNLGTTSGPDFTPVNPPLFPPTLVSPGNGVSPGPALDNLTPTFSWNAAASATGYGLYITDLSAGGAAVYPVGGGAATPIAGTSFTLPSGVLQWGHNYRWAMTTFDGSGEYPTRSNFSFFQTQTAAPADIATAYQAEDATRSGPVLGTAQELIDRPGWTGTGYLDFGNGASEYIQWTVTANSAGRHRLSFRYALGATGSRPLSISVNGTVVNSSLAFPYTGSWGTWESVALDANLLKGTNTIRATVAGSSGANIDRLDVIGPGPVPPGAVVLFDGTSASAAANWVRDADGAASNWFSSNGWLQVNHTASPNDIVSVQKYKNCSVHVEWFAPSGGTGLTAANSGVKLQRRYEMQILNTGLGTALSDTTAGAIYGFRKGDTNVSPGAGVWQSYDITYTAPLFSGPTKVANARITAYWNGVLVHNNIEVPSPTAGSPTDTSALDGILLQELPTDATGEVLFRNIWVLPAPTPSQYLTNWFNAYNLTGADATALATPSHDGITNIWKYASGADPQSPLIITNGYSYLPQMQLISQDGNQYLQFTYRRRTDWAARGLRFTAETSSTLANESWTPQPYTQIGNPIPTGDNITEMVTIRIDQPIPPDTLKQFSRINVELLQ